MARTLTENEDNFLCRLKQKCLQFCVNGTNLTVGWHISRLINHAHTVFNKISANVPAYLLESSLPNEIQSKPAIFQIYTPHLAKLLCQGRYDFLFQSLRNGSLVFAYWEAVNRLFKVRNLLLSFCFISCIADALANLRHRNFRRELKDRDFFGQRRFAKWCVASSWWCGTRNESECGGQEA